MKQKKAAMGWARLARGQCKFIDFYRILYVHRLINKCLNYEFRISNVQCLIFARKARPPASPKRPVKLIRSAKQRAHTQYRSHFAAKINMFRFLARVQSAASHKTRNGPAPPQFSILGSRNIYMLRAANKPPLINDAFAQGNII